jgi:outer membrane protein OmpA-like peptidoglycan-associated protein
VGLSYNFGAGDADKDGVSDQKDVCPDVPGLKEFDGCPDTDGDGIPDNKDKCPEEAGTEALEGCPDSDGDGIADADDACPNEAGTAAMNGCPDSDGDGVADNEDKCPNEAGEAANNGCPWGDTDGDGVKDNEDKCPNEAGPASNDGCPDKMPEAIADFINSEKARILFNASKTTIRNSYTSYLDELASLLSQYSNAVITIEGHASSDGSDAYNQALSERRASAVKAYLVGKGIDASRIDTIGFGETKPIDNNGTAKGRRNNRRAQIERRAEIKVN